MLNKLIEFISYFWSQAVEFFTWAFDTIISFLIDIAYYIFDGFLIAVETIFNLIDFTQITTLSTLQSWTGLPDQTIWLLNYLNIPACLAFIIGAYTIRFLMNLIPSWATRV